MTDNTTNTAPVDADWWRGAVLYQIYPRSFQDSNDDGIGDIPGIISRLPYVKSLGVDCIWISPFFRSPMRDFGYDISDYCDIDTMFGTLDDFDALIARAHELGIRIVIDLVLSHSSSDHPWFAESRQSRDNPRADWYVWADPKPDGSPPNNWLSVFGGSAWEWDGERMQYYLHNFLVEQPDLNFHNPVVQDEMLEVVRYWLDRGVDGFRLDVVNFYVHDKYLRDNPALMPDERNDKTAPAVNPYNFQNHMFSKSRPENLDFLRKMRLLMDEYPEITSVGEVGDNERGTEIQAQYTSGGDKLHMCYDFALLSGEMPTGTYYNSVMEAFNSQPGDGWACWATSNHDVVRHRSRWNLSPEHARVVTAMTMAIRGTVCIYQGEELGFTEADVAFENLQDPYGKRFWPRFKGRDGCRTPMAWVADNSNGGFSQEKPWLPVAPEHVSVAAATQEDDADSMLTFYRRLIAFRKTLPALVKGTYSPVLVEDDQLAFVREHAGEKVFCAFNLADASREVALPAGDWAQAEGAPFASTFAPGGITLPPYQAAFAVSRAA